MYKNFLYGFKQYCVDRLSILFIFLKPLQSLSVATICIAYALS